jgi:hypothetical protein
MARLCLVARHGFATTRAPCQNLCTQTHGSALDSLGSCQSALEATGTRRTCRAPGHWVSSRPCARTCECRAETLGFWARRQPRFLTPLHRQSALRAFASDQAGGLTTAAHAASRLAQRRWAASHATGQRAGFARRAQAASCEKNSVPLAGDLCPATTPQPVSHVRCCGAKPLSLPSAMAPHHYLQLPVGPASCPAFARSIKPVLFTPARPADKGSLDLPQLLPVHIHVHCFQCDYKL